MAVTDEAINKIKDMILAGTLRPGDRLPREADLADRLGLSRNSLREAVKALSLINVLDVRRGDGTYVTSLEPSLLLGALDFVAELNRDDTVLHFFEVRRILEPAATAMAAGRMTDADLRTLDALLDAVGDSTSIDELVRADLEFHRAIAQASGNPVLASLLESTSAPTLRARVWRGLTQTGALERTTSEHRAIVHALAARDAERARAWATMHVAGIEMWLRSVG
ncbi:FadR/GntR family transcriptional regulator [Catenuloplanes japonicus]|uniref:FadR/GntR family transcriptional regulator n=1 Tax=Catenuloplanes japonicus TaxID=33876 RepID=UPI000524EFBA|nr:FadR/GntR family transcriptional regulator [Catenuloplanes japonicus]